ncbi:MAG: hypothetical protein ACTXOO_01755 [Sodalis sp. (in: enterobacteria)]
MDKFKLEDALKPDSSDQSPSCQQKSLTMLKVPISRQHLMIGIGILVLLLLVISIGSALKSPLRIDSRSSQGADNNGQRNIDISGLTSCSDASLSCLNSIASSRQESLELPDNMAAALSQQKNQGNGATAKINGQGAVSTLPTTAATLTLGSRSGTQPQSSSTAKSLAARGEPKLTLMMPSNAPRALARRPRVFEPHRPLRRLRLRVLQEQFNLHRLTITRYS